MNTNSSSEVYFASHIWLFSSTSPFTSFLCFIAPFCFLGLTVTVHSCSCSLRARLSCLPWRKPLKDIIFRKAQNGQQAHRSPKRISVALPISLVLHHVQAHPYTVPRRFQALLHLRLPHPPAWLDCPPLSRSHLLLRRVDQPQVSL